MVNLSPDIGIEVNKSDIDATIDRRNKRAVGAGGNVDFLTPTRDKFDKADYLNPSARK